MKIALIQPNSPFLTNERVFPNIGLLRVGTKLQQEGHDVKVYDFSGYTPREIEKPIEDISNKYQLYGFSATTPQMPYATDIHNYLKTLNPKARTVIGGPHATALYHLKERGIPDKNISDLEKFDTIFAGEGESTENIFKYGWQKGAIIKNIDDTPIPDREMINIHSYNYDGLEGKTTTIQTQRGCPGKCTFCCGRDIEMYNKVRQHSPDRVIKELDMLNEKYGYKNFMWYDDEINVSMGRLEKLCDKLSKRDYKHRGFIRSDYVLKEPKQLDWLKKAGFIKLCAGVETGSNKMLRRIKKQTTSEMNSEVRKMIKDKGIHYESFLMLGHPGETIEDIKETINWVKKNKPDDFDLNLIMPLPGSKMYNDAKESNKFPGYDWEYNGSFFNKPRYSVEDSFYKGINAKGKSDIRTETLTNKQLNYIRDNAEKYLRRKIKE